MLAARERCAAGLVAAFARVGISYPASTVLLRGFKRERLLEVWATIASPELGSFHQVGIYPILGTSGELGPKLCEGDRQVPEGFYRVTRFNPRSRYHLSLGLDYPNAADLRRTTNPMAPGSDIFIHGGTESRGCLALGDAAIEEIYLLTRDAKQVLVCLYPCRMTEQNCREQLAPLIVQNPALAEFWGELQANHDFFERDHRLPRVPVYPHFH